MTTRKKAVLKKEDDNRVRDYELVLIVNPEVDEESLENTVSSVSQYITDRGGTVSDVERWGKKKLAYQLRHFLEGTYMLARFKMSPSRTRELEASLQISEDILKHMLIKLGD